MSVFVMVAALFYIVILLEYIGSWIMKMAEKPEPGTTKLTAYQTGTNRVLNMLTEEDGYQTRQ